MVHDDESNELVSFRVDPEMENSERNLNAYLANKKIKPPPGEKVEDIYDPVSHE